MSLNLAFALLESHHEQSFTKCKTALNKVVNLLRMLIIEVTRLVGNATHCLSSMMKKFSAITNVKYLKPM